MSCPALPCPCPVLPSHWIDCIDPTSHHTSSSHPLLPTLPISSFHPTDLIFLFSRLHTSINTSTTPSQPPPFRSFTATYYPLLSSQWILIHAPPLNLNTVPRTRSSYLIQPSTSASLLHFTAMNDCTTQTTVINVISSTPLSSSR